ncbi:Voldacs domain-containing protein [Aspergillus clavatus NRRL 1]|uniref:Regulator of volume decrease after cellular swelling n=1 Tax=Aspergillus clavatus (strain ATCC 1007 / CBS 513.65 / DSM 816 / NCTC 3887 / NRRL 1 / QM 1276 / 107) TaxID=344612 RepID=A1CAC3_ASPCL|nr:uncharacterized protein ACLA_011180 [Aspergillus clavatus NRRL 1]EAW12691.1 conserved hypothetical protein [Aspergillus clavatus NRRL 1]
MEPLRSAPEASSFVLLADHQSRTPESFHSGPPVLHYHSKHCKLVILERDLLSTPVLTALRGPSPTANGAGDHAPTTTDKEVDEGKEIVLDGIDVWVTSEYVHAQFAARIIFHLPPTLSQLTRVSSSKFLLYAPAVSAGVAIPYPSISLHAIQRLHVPGTAPDAPQSQGLYMQIATPAAPGTNPDDEEEESITMTIVPPTGAGFTAGTASAADATLTASEQAMEDQSETPDETPTQMLYAAVSACSNLHPDPMEEDAEEEEEERDSLLQSGFISMGSADGGLPPPVPGSSGWITAENVGEFFDEQGNWIGGGEAPSLPLGPGAGSVRQREDDGQISGQDEQNDGEETKWRRTD